MITMLADTRDHTVGKLMEMFSLTGSLAGGVTGAAAYQQALPDQATARKLEADKEKRKKDQEDKKANLQAAIQP
jgi:hypothetical protein